MKPEFHGNEHWKGQVSFQGPEVSTLVHSQLLRFIYEMPSLLPAD